MYMSNAEIALRKYVDDLCDLYSAADPRFDKLKRIIFGVLESGTDSATDATRVEIKTLFLTLWDETSYNKSHPDYARNKELWSNVLFRLQDNKLSD